jgi:hypothetical protein
VCTGWEKRERFLQTHRGVEEFSVARSAQSFSRRITMSYLKCARFMHREGLKPRIHQGKVEDPENQFRLKVAEGE